MSPNDRPAAEGTLLSHLIELRNRLVWSLLAIGVVFGALVPFANEVYGIIAKPLIDVLPAGMTMIATEVASPFLTPLKFTLAAAITITIPFLLYQLWAFVAPGLYRHEKRMVVPLVVSSVLLFYAGMAFAYFVVFPMAFKFLVGFLPPGVQMMTDIKAYLDFVFSMFFAFGVAFEVPVAVVILTLVGVINPESLAEKRPYVFLGCFVVAAVLTPPDVASQIMLALPMYGLFEIGLYVARRIGRKRRAAEEGTLTYEEMEREIDKYTRDNPDIDASGSGKKTRPE